MSFCFVHKCGCAKTDVLYLQIFDCPFKSLSIFFLREIQRSYCQFFSSAIFQDLAHKQSPEPKTVHVDLKAMLWTGSSLGCAGTSACDCAHVHVCENVSYVSAGGRFYQWHIQYTHRILITQFDIQMRGQTSHRFTHLHSSPRLLKGSICLHLCWCFFNSASEWVWVNKDFHENVRFSCESGRTSPWIMMILRLCQRCHGWLSWIKSSHLAYANS